MSDIAFHLNAPDKLGYACRLLRKAHARGARAIVYGPEIELTQLDQALWRLEGPDFVPHCGDSDPPFVQRASPILLTALAPLNQVFEATVLVNLGAAVPEGFERFERIIEVVTAFAPEVALARVRWKAYKTNGHEPYAHDLDQIRAPKA
jgi:DNA polymerase-3 subunit chi